jgi:uncharacterized protein YjbJ (UPF0337 family)
MNISFASRYAATKTALKRMLLVALVSLSLWSVSNPAYAADANDYYTNDRGGLQATERYDKIQPKTGEYNNFDDVDPRQDTSRADAKARAEIDDAKRRNAQTNDPLEPAREAVSNLKENLGGKAERATSKVNYQVEKAADKLSNRAERAVDRIQD